VRAVGELGAGALLSPFTCDQAAASALYGQLGLADLRRDSATVALADSACASAASYCCCETSSLASRPFRRSALRSSRVAFASSPTRRACAAASGQSIASRLCCASSDAACDSSTPLSAETTPLFDVAVVIGTAAFAAAASASAVASSARARSSANLVITRVQLHQHIPGLHLLVVDDRHV
jgi:hypothetical protein